MKTIKYKIIAIIGLLSFSCDITDSIDDLGPFYKVTDDLVFVDAQRTESALNGVYTMQIRHFGKSFSLLGLFYPNTASGGFDNNQVEVKNSLLFDYYRRLYRIIQSANFLIERLQSGTAIPGLTDARSLEMQGEASLHRAIAHFRVLRQFGQFYDTGSPWGVVLRTEPIIENTGYPRSTVQEVYDSILSDLDFAISNAPSTHTPGYLSQSTAKAYKAKVLLYMQDWTGAANLALEIINSGVYELKPDFRDIYREGYDSAENIFSPIATHPTSSSPGSGRFSFPDTPLTSIADASVGGPADGNFSTGEGLDPRYAYTRATDLLVPSATHSNKYPFSESSSATGLKTNSHFFLRLGEMYLIYAEAKARMAASGVDPDALDKLNDIRFRADQLPDAAPTTKAELLEAIRIEKILELNDENNEPWFDFIRYHILNDINGFTIRPTINSVNQFIFPMSFQVLEGNIGLEQNPGY